MTAEQERALEAIAGAAVYCERETGCPAELSAAQCILESGWLTRCPGNNCFGIKAGDGQACTYQMTREFLNGQWRTMQAAFRAFDSLADCFSAHARLLQGGCYAGAWRAYGEDRDLDKLIAGLARHYATDPGYAAAVTELAHGPHVAAALAAAREAAI